MTSQYRRPVPACASHVRHLCFCIGITLLLAAPAPAEMIDTASYDSWRWNGFAWSPLSEASSSLPLASTSLLAASGQSGGGNSYNAWQWGGFAHSSPYVPTAATLSSLTLQQMANLSDGTGGTASLSGFVYVDANQNGIMETTDWVIFDAKISLTKEGSSDPPLIVYTELDGAYAFDGLLPGTYSITMLTPCPQPGQEILGVLRDEDGHLVPDPPGPGQVMEDGFYDIVLEDGYWGVNYNFSESTYPVEAFSKRLLINGGIHHTVPEPAPLALLVIAGLILGGFIRKRGQAHILSNPGDMGEE